MFSNFSLLWAYDKRGLISTVSAVPLIKRKKTTELSTPAFEAARCDLQYRKVSAGFNIKRNACCTPVLLSPLESSDCHVRKHQKLQRCRRNYSPSEVFFFQVTYSCELSWIIGLEFKLWEFCLPRKDRLLLCYTAPPHLSVIGSRKGADVC